MTLGRIKLLAMALGVVAFGVAWGALLAAMPRCLRGHSETRQVPARTVTRPMFVGKVLIYTSHVIPAHEEECWVCDKWESR